MKASILVFKACEKKIHESEEVMPLPSMLSLKNSISIQENTTADTWLNLQANPTSFKVLNIVAQMGEIETRLRNEL